MGIASKQEEAILSFLDGKDTFVSLPTGYGKLLIYVIGSEKRYTMAHTMIFLYKRCCSKTRNIFIH